MIFDDRIDGGRRLAAELSWLLPQHPVVIALPRGGVPVAVPVARALGAPLELLSVRKLGAPENPEFAVGAMAEDGVAIVDRGTVAALGLTDAEIERVVERETRELRRRVERFRGSDPPTDVRGRTVVVVDDGLATGLTDLAAVRALRGRGAARIVVAVPVGSPQAVAMLREEADEVVCLEVPDDLGGVGRWYRDFGQVSDEEVLAALADAGVPAAPTPPASAEGVPSHGLTLRVDGAVLGGDLTVPAGAAGLVIFAHGSGSSRHSPRNRDVARALNAEGLATLLFDLLSDEEEGRRDLVFDTELLGARLAAVTRWAAAAPATEGLSIGYFGASTGAAAALRAAADLGDLVGAVVSRGGRPDLAAERLAEVRAPTLLIVGSLDTDVLELNRQAAARMRCPNEIAVVEGATHLFEEPGTLDEVARLASAWLRTHLAAASLGASEA